MNRKVVMISSLALCVVLTGIIYFIYHTNNKQTRIVLKSDDTTYTVHAGEKENEMESESELPPVPNTIKVYITGAVNQPGVYELPEDSRMEDVVEMAGGITEEADSEQVNLAAHIGDAQHIKIPKAGEAVDKSQIKEENSPVENSKVNINTGSLNDLMTLPGIGAVTAGNIIDYREQNENFKSIEEIKEVTRIGDKTFERIKDMICVD